MRALSASLCVLAMACDVGAQTPNLSISLFAPNIAQVSWSTNFSAWQLFTATNLTSPGAWQPVSPGPFPFGNMLVVFVAITNQSGFYRSAKRRQLRLSRNAFNDFPRRQQHA